MRNNVYTELSIHMIDRRVEKKVFLLLEDSSVLVKSILGEVQALFSHASGAHDHHELTIAKNAVSGRWPVVTTMFIPPLPAAFSSFFKTSPSLFSECTRKCHSFGIKGHCCSVVMTAVGG